MVGRPHHTGALQLNEHALAVLELPKILERVAAHAAFSASRELVLASRPSADPDSSAASSADLRGRRLLEIRPGIGIGGARDIRSAVERASRAASSIRRNCSRSRRTLARFPRLCGAQ